MLLGIPFASASLYYARKGFRQLRGEGRGIAGLVIVVILAIGEILAGLALILVLIAAIVGAKK